MLAESTFTTTHHVSALVGFALVTAALVVSGRRHETPTRYLLATLSLGAWLLSSIFYVLPANLAPEISLPLQACDLLGLFAAITLFLPSRLMRSVMYFGGIGMTTQAFVTPTSDIGAPDNIKFWIFWLLHGAILATAIYTVAVNRFRPTFKDLVSATLFWLVYGLAMIGLNYATFAAGLNQGKGWYYGYLGPHLPETVQDSILRFLGDWPLRPVLMMLLVLVIFVLLYLPWLIVPGRGGGGADAGQNSGSSSASSSSASSASP